MEAVADKQAHEGSRSKVASWFIVMIVLSIVRIWLGLKAFAMYDTNTYLDEWMLFRYSYLPGHFAATNDPFAMAKDMSFPLFLNLVHFSGLPYTLVVSLLWVAAAWMVYILSRRLMVSMNELPASGTRSASWKEYLYPVLAFTFILFLPSAFDALAGTKLYRNAIIAPCTLLYVLSLIFFLYTFLRNGKGLERQTLLWSSISGLLLAFNYYITENGFWLLIPTILILGAGLFSVGRKIALNQGWKDRSIVKWTVVRITMCSIPLIILAGWSIGYKAINHHFYGVFQINTRTDGEPGRFVQNIYRIASPNRTYSIWTPADAIDQAFAASPTLSSVPELHKTLVEDNVWAGGSIYDHPLTGDRLTWVLPDAMSQAGLWQSHAQVEQFFRQVNTELDQAFQSGKLKKDKRIQLVSSASGLTWSEIAGLRPLLWQGIKTGVWYDGYAYAFRLGDLNSFDSMTIDQRGISANYFTNSFLEQSPYTGYYVAERVTTDRMQIAIIKLYQLVGLPVFLLACVGMILLLRSVFKTRRGRKDKEKASISTDALVLLFMVATFIGAIVVILGIAWYSNYLWSHAHVESAVYPMKYYGVASVALIAVFDVLGTTIVWRRLLNAVNDRKISFADSKNSNHEARET